MYFSVWFGESFGEWFGDEAGPSGSIYAGLLGTSTTIAALTGTIAADASLLGTSTTVADITATIAADASLLGTSTTVADISATLAVDASLLGTSTTVAVITATTVADASLTGTSATVADITATIAADASLLGTSTTVASITAGLGVDASLFGASDTTADITATIAADTSLLGASDLTAELTTSLAPGDMYAELVGTSTTSLYVTLGPFRVSTNNALADTNSPGIASRGPYYWPPTAEVVPGDLEAVDDLVSIEVGYGVVVSVLANDSGVGLSVTSVTLQDATDGVVTTNGTTVTFIPSNTKFVDLAVGESVDITITYTIIDVDLNTDTAFLVVHLTRQFDIWIDQDSNPIIDFDDAFIAQYPIPVFAWIDMDGLFVIDQDEALVEML